MDTDAHQTCIDALIREHGRYLRRLARRWCRAPLDPDDLLQDLFERSLRSSVPPDPKKQRAWLSRVMYNLFVDRIRRHGGREQLVGDPPDVVIGDDSVWWESLDETHVLAELARLPEAQRTTFELFSFRSKSYQMIASELGIAMATVGTRVLRTREALRIRLTERFQT